jgi:hypothetical protein
VRAYADEWCAHYNYSFGCYVVSGPSSSGLVELLRRKSQRALEHARELAQRIIELGGQPIAKLGSVVNSATDKPFKLPENIPDLDEVLKAVLDAERTSMRSYHDLEEKTRGRIWSPTRWFLNFSEKPLRASESSKDFSVSQRQRWTGAECRSPCTRSALEEVSKSSRINVYRRREHAPVSPNEATMEASVNR